MIMNKQGMLMRDWIIVVVLFGAFAGIGGLIVADLSDPVNGYNNPNISDSNFDAAYNSVTDTTNIVGKMENATISNEGLTPIGGAELLFGSTISIIHLTFSSIGMVNNAFGNMVASFGIPPPIANIVFPVITAIITIILIFIVISSLTKTKV